jgi:hypothetical protein
MKPERIQRRRIKGWRTPPNTINVARLGKWGNPFKVPKHGTQAECVTLLAAMLRGEFCLTTDNLAEQQAYYAMAHRDRGEIVGKNLACYCEPGTPCHVDVLLAFANATAAAAEREIVSSALLDDLQMD